MKSLGIKENIKLLREKYKLSQKDLALIAGVTDKAVSTWESGAKEPRMGAIQKIADHFGLKKSNLIEDNGLTEKQGYYIDPEAAKMAKNFMKIQVCVYYLMRPKMYLRKI